MQLEYKPDFDQTQARWIEFWKGENKRPLVSCIVPKPNSKYRGPNKHLAGLPIKGPRDMLGIPGEPPPYLAGIDGNFQPLIEQLYAWADSHEFIGEAIPGYYLEFGPDTFAGYLGAQLDYYEDSHTTWCVPFVQDWDDTEIRFQREGHWWQLTVEFARALKKEFDGKLMIVPPTLVANLDALSAIRGTQELMLDMVMTPEKVKRALETVNHVHTEVLNALAQEFEFTRYGSLNIEATYTPGQHSRPQCDAACLISTPMFREFVVPCLEYESRDQDAVVFHLDGPGALHQVEALCGVEKLDMIAWMPGTGNEDKDWSNLYGKIDRLGKGQVRHATHEEIKALWTNCKSKKLYFWTDAASRMKAEDLIAELENLPNKQVKHAKHAD